MGWQSRDDDHLSTRSDRRWDARHGETRRFRRPCRVVPWPLQWLGARSRLGQRLSREERMKKYFTPFRIATYLLLLFCAGHTAGGMLSQKSLGADADAVFDQMKTVSFV